MFIYTSYNLQVIGYSKNFVSDSRFINLNIPFFYSGKEKWNFATRIIVQISKDFEKDIISRKHCEKRENVSYQHFLLFT